VSGPSRIRTADGWELAVTVHEARAPRAVVVLLHAMMVDARSLDRPVGAGLATTLAAAGLEVWRADLRGHGASGPTPSERGRWSYDDLVRGDVPAIVAAARERGLPVAVVGHSLGGHVAAAAAAEGLGVDALVLLAANVWLPSLDPSRRRRLAKELVIRSFEASVRPLGAFPSRRLRAGPADESAAYVRDLCRFWREDRFASADGADWLAGLREVRAPVLAVAGAGDRLFAHPEPFRRFCDAFPPGAVDFRVAREWDATHVGLACDPRSRPTWDAVARWLLGQLPPSSRGDHGIGAGARRLAGTSPSSVAPPGSGAPVQQSSWT